MTNQDRDEFIKEFASEDFPNHFYETKLVEYVWEWIKTKCEQEAQMAYQQGYQEGLVEGEFQGRRLQSYETN